jgi:hypothetical protein
MHRTILVLVLLQVLAVDLGAPAVLRVSSHHVVLSASRQPPQGAPSTRSRRGPLTNLLLQSLLCFAFIAFPLALACETSTKEHKLVFTTQTSNLLPSHSKFLHLEVELSLSKNKCSESVLPPALAVAVAWHEDIYDVHIRLGVLNRKGPLKGAFSGSFLHIAQYHQHCTSTPNFLTTGEQERWLGSSASPVRWRCRSGGYS